MLCMNCEVFRRFFIWIASHFEDTSIELRHLKYTSFELSSFWKILQLNYEALSRYLIWIMRHFRNTTIKLWGFFKMLQLNDEAFLGTSMEWHGISKILDLNFEAFWRCFNGFMRHFWNTSWIMIHFESTFEKPHN